MAKNIRNELRLARALARFEHAVRADETAGAQDPADAEEIRDEYAAALLNLTQEIAAVCNGEVIRG